MDRGANGGLAGSDMRVIYKTHRKINISGIDNHEVTGLDVVTAATLLNTSLGKVIGIFNEYAYLGKGSSIHSSGQLEWFKTLVDEKSIKVGGTQLITTLDGYSVPLLIRDGLAYATSLGRPTDQDMDTYPHVFFTSPDEWDPSVLDHDPPHLDGLDPSQVSDQHFGDPMFDAYGDFNERIIANLNILLDAPPGDCGSYTAISSVSKVNLHQSSPQEPDWDALRPFFAWTSPSSIKDTFNVTTRHGTAPHTQDYIKKHFKSRNPVFNIPRRSEAVATDTILSDTPAVDDGSTMAQFFCGRDTLVCDAYGIKSTKQFINTLSDNIRKRGAMDTLISDGGKYEISKRVTDLLRSLFIQDYQSEPYHQHQNKAENRFGLAKRYTNIVMNQTVTAVLHFLNQTPIDAYTKRQSTVETATYGSEFVAARTAVDQIIDIRTTLRYLGVPIRDKSYMFGDNRSVVTSSTIPNSAISKRHHLASYHRVREAIAAKFISFHWKDGKSNPADILSKHWEFATVWPLLKPILFWRGETATQLKGSDRIPSTTPDAEPPGEARDSGSARSHSTHLETSSSNRP